MGEESRMCGKRERRTPRFLTDFLTDEKLLKNTRLKESRTTATTLRRPQSRPLSWITENSGLSTFCKRVTLKKIVEIDNVNSGNKEYDSEESATASEGSEPTYVRGCATDFRLKNTRPWESSSITTSADSRRRRLQTRPLSRINGNSSLSTFRKRAALKKKIRIDNVNNGNKEYDSEETATASEGSEPLYVRGCTADCRPKNTRPRASSSTTASAESPRSMGEESRMCGKRERRIPRFLADFLTDEKLPKITRPKASRTTATTHRRLQSRPLSRITGDPGLSTFCKRVTFKKKFRLDNVNSGNKGYDSEETISASETSDRRPDQESETEIHEKEFYYTEHDAQVALPTLSHRDMCRPPFEDPDYQRQLVASYSSDQGSETESDYEKEFYYTEHDVQAQVALPTLSHRDMCRPPFEDPDYQRQLVASYRRGLLSTEHNKKARPISTAVSHSWSNSHSPKHMNLSATNCSPSTPGRRAHFCRKKYGVGQRQLWCKQCRWNKKHRYKSSLSRMKPRASEINKCRQVYGRDQHELWCTQCKWKKACTRFRDDDDI